MHATCDEEEKSAQFIQIDTALFRSNSDCKKYAVYLLAPGHARVTESVLSFNFIAYCLLQWQPDTECGSLPERTVYFNSAMMLLNNAI